MTKDMDHERDEKTVLFDRQGPVPAARRLTDSAAASRYEPLEERMIHSSGSGAAGTLNISINPLVAAASGVLSDLVKIRDKRLHIAMSELNLQLVAGLERFADLALQEGIESSQVMAARYVLCTVADEVVVTTFTGEQSQWSQMNLLSRFHNETFGGEKFFQLLERLSRNPVKHLAMLELMYLCLSLGFEGKYRVQARGAVELEDVRDALYRQIRQLRGDVPRQLSPHWQGLSDQPQRLVRIVPAWLVVMFTVFCLGVMYSGFAWVLGEQRDTVMRTYQSFDPTTAQPPSQP